MIFIRFAWFFAILALLVAALALHGCGSRNEDGPSAVARPIPTHVEVHDYVPTKTVTPREVRGITHASRPYHVALILSEDPLCRITSNAFREAATGAGMSVEVQRPSAADIEAQARLLKSDLAKSYDAVCLMPAGEGANISVLKARGGKGPAILEIGGRAFAYAAQKQGVFLSGDIHVDDPQAGILAGTALFATLRRRDAKVAIIRSDRKDDREAERIEGFRNSIGKKLDIVATESAGANAKSAEAAAKRLIAAQPQLAGIFCSDESLVPAVADSVAAASASARIVIVGFGNTPAIQSRLHSGRLAATVTLNPDAIGTMSARFVAGLLDGKFEKGTELDLPVNTVTSPTKR